MELPRLSNRRIGERAAVDPVALILVSETTVTGRLGRQRLVQHERQARLVDVSVSGAAVEAPEVPGLEPGAAALLRFGDMEAMVEVRRVSPADQPDVLRYGMQFTKVSTRLQERLDLLLGEGRPYDRREGGVG